MTEARETIEILHRQLKLDLLALKERANEMDDAEARSELQVMTHNALWDALYSLAKVIDSK